MSVFICSAYFPFTYKSVCNVYYICLSISLSASICLSLGMSVSLFFMHVLMKIDQ